MQTTIMASSVCGKCEICEGNIAKYRCPRCKLMTCSLECVKKHKVDKNCDGVRDKTEFVAKNQFSDIHLSSDYRFLEDTERCSNNARRNRPNLPYKRNSYWTERLVKECRQRGINLILMPSKFFSKRKENSTKFYEMKKKIFWHIKWTFSTVDGSIITKKIEEDLILNKVVDDLIKSKTSLKSYKSVNEIQVIIKTNKNSFSLLDLNQTICDNLKGKTIVEYPTLTIIFKSELNKYKIENPPEPEIIEDEKNNEINQISDLSDDELNLSNIKSAIFQ